MSAEELRKLKKFKKIAKIFIAEDKKLLKELAKR